MRGDSSGPAVARLFQCLLALVFLGAWLSLRAQVDQLIGSRGLLPIAPLLSAASQRDWPTPWDFPTVFWLNASDVALHTGIWAGCFLALAVLAGWRARFCLAVSTALYLSYATVGRTFFSFQWDNLLIECGFLATFLPTNKHGRWIHFLFRVLLFKLYWESGVAKWQSHLHDWHDGSAMTFYYETAPLPTWIAWYAHALPTWWHETESRVMLMVELVIPFAIFGPCRVRLTAFAVFTAFLVINVATANYGFFCYLTGILHVFLLTDGDVQRLRSWMPSPRPALQELPPPGEGARRRLLPTVGAATMVAAFLFVSTVDGLLAFGGNGAWRNPAEALRHYYQPWRLVNSYHLFGHITRQRVEAEFQVFAGQEWTPLLLRYKPGDPLEPPAFAAPHQPRVDFQLWFYGLGFRGGTPEYVSTLLQRLCRDPEAVKPLFRTTLPAHPESVRIAYFRYNFTTPEERRQSGAWWRRNPLGMNQPLVCR